MPVVSRPTSEGLQVVEEDGSVDVEL